MQNGQTIVEKSTVICGLTETCNEIRICNIWLMKTHYHPKGQLIFFLFPFFVVNYYVHDVLKDEISDIKSHKIRFLIYIWELLHSS